MVLGARGVYVGSEEYHFNQLEIVKKAMKLYEDEIGRIKLKAQIAENQEVAKEYLHAFAFRDNLYINSDEHNECANYIKNCLESIQNEKEVNRLLQRYGDKSTRIGIKNEIKHDKKLTKEYIKMFKRLKNDIGLNKQQKKCLSFIKFFGKKF